MLLVQELRHLLLHDRVREGVLVRDHLVDRDAHGPDVARARLVPAVKDLGIQKYFVKFWRDVSNFARNRRPERDRALPPNCGRSIRGCIKADFYEYQ